MATTTRIVLTEEQRRLIAEALRMEPEHVPEELGIVAVSPEAGEHMGLPTDMQSKFSPALIIT